MCVFVVSWVRWTTNILQYIGMLRITILLYLRVLHLSSKYRHCFHSISLLFNIYDDFSWTASTTNNNKLICILLYFYWKITVAFCVPQNYWETSNVCLSIIFWLDKGKRVPESQSISVKIKCLCESSQAITFSEKEKRRFYSEIVSSLHGLQLQWFCDCYMWQEFYAFKNTMFKWGTSKQKAKKK